MAADQLAELAAAMSTLELKSGNRKLGRKFAQLVSTGASENAVAQLRWIAERFPVPFDPALLNTRWSYEARSNFDRAIGNWNGCVQNASNWFWDEPFAIRPIYMATFIEAEVLGNLDSAHEFAKRALIANEDDATAINNLVYVLAMKGRLDEADMLQSRAHRYENKAEHAVSTATRGMLAFRKGHLELGRRLYLEAIEALTRLKFRSAALIARMHLLIESAYSGSQDIVSFTREKLAIKGEVDSLNDKVIAAIFDNLLSEDGPMFVELLGRAPGNTLSLGH